MTAPAQMLVQGAPTARPARRRWVALIGLVPFFLAAFLFLLLPTAFLIVGSFQDAQGNLTLSNYGDLAQDFIVDAVHHEPPGQPRDGRRWAASSASSSPTR